MIIAKAPLRISFVGGGSDLPSHYEKHGGACLSMAIDKYVYVAVNRRFNNDIRLSYSKTEIVSDISELEHELAREIFSASNIHHQTEVVSIADIPGSGSGLGSSSTFTVAMLLALSEYRSYYRDEFSYPFTPETLAQTACTIEIDILKKPIGKQDQYASVYGGINQFIFGLKGDVAVVPIAITTKLKNGLADHLMLFYTGITRKSFDVLWEQDGRNKVGKNVQNLNRMATISDMLTVDFIQEDVSNLGAYLHENWILKRELSSVVSNPNLDAIYETAMKAGATGGKITGAGGGGFLLICSPPEKKTAIRQALGLKEIHIKPDPQGARIIFMERLHD